MTTESRHISAWVGQPADKVYAFVSDPANLPKWASKLTSTVEREGDRWYTETADGRAGYAFTAPNGLGVLDHTIETPSGEIVYRPTRVIEAPEGSEVVVTLRRRPGISDAEYERDTEVVAAGLTRLKVILEDMP